MNDKDGPPLTPAYYGDLWTGKDEGLDPADESRNTVDDFAAMPSLLPRWVLDDEARGLPEFTLELVEHVPRQHAVLRGGGVLVRCAADASGYVLVTAERDGAELFRAFIDRPYEEYDLWPPGAVFPGRRSEEAPGRIGKRRSWVVLDTRTWPILAPLANEAGFVMLREVE